MRRKKSAIGRALPAMLIAGLATVAFPVSAFAEHNGNVTIQAKDSRVIKGSVVDENGSPLIGVTVKLQSTNGGTITDVNGNFSISAAANKTAVVSYAGYISQTVQLKDGIQIQLKPDAIGLEDVVVVGYGTVKKKDLTGAVASVKTEDITISPTNDAMEALQGKVAGLDIVKSSGRVGSNVEILLRGSRSMYGNNSPLFIIDGVQGGSYDDVNPSDIESIDVLKDASSTAIYGSAGANGVIIITTKRGSEGKPRVTFDSYWSFGGEPNFQHGMTGDEWMTYQREAFKYTHGNYPADDASLFGNAEYYDAYKQGKWIDWSDLMKNKASQQKYAFSISGGSKMTKVFASGSYTNQKGLLETEGQKVYQLRLNLDQGINKWLKSSFTSNINYSNRDNGHQRTFTDALTKFPLGEPYNDDGSIRYQYIQNQYSPLGDYIENQYAENNRTTHISLSGSLEWTPIDGLSAKTTVNGIIRHQRNGRFRGQECNANLPSYGAPAFAEASNKHDWQYSWENVISYNKSIKDHSFGAQAISSYIVGETEFTRAYENGVAMDAFQWHKFSRGTNTFAYSEYQKWQRLSYAVRVNYSYKGRYLFNFSNRWDGVSWFADGKKWDSFPAVAVGWRISDEAFMGSAKDWLDNLKLRVGYGVTGNAGMIVAQNENGISDANAYATQSVPFYYPSTGMRDGGFAPVVQYSKYGSSTLGWEKSYNWNIGLDFAVLNSRLSGSIEYFRTKTEGLLFMKQMPITSGITGWGSPLSSWQNLAKTQNYGIEATISSQNIVKKNFRWSTNFTATWSREKIVDLPIEAGYFIDTAQGKNLFVGEPVRSLYDYKYLGIWSTAEAAEAAKYNSEPGLIKVETLDKNGDGGIHAYGPDDRQVLGHTNPDWILGMTNNFSAYGFDLSIHMMGRIGQTIKSDMLGRYTADDAVTTNQISGVDYWTESNQGAYYPRPGSKSKQTAYYTALCYVDGSFFKIKNITLGYTIPENITKKALIERLRVYVTAYNPFIATNKLLKDTDPETGGSDRFPTYKEFVVGLNLTF